MPKFIRLTAAAGDTGRFNVEHIAQYQTHVHADNDCDEAGLEPCRLQTVIFLTGMDISIGCRETAEEVDRLIDPHWTP